MNTVIAKDSSYEVNAFVGSRNLDDGAAISSTDSIRPSFSSEVEDDPDVTGLRVSLETPDGKAAASDVVYRLSSAGAAREAGEEPILVPRFSGELPAFGLPADLAVGRYVLVMRVLGEDGVLYEQRRSIYYLADAKFSLSRVVSYPPGTGPSTKAPLFPTDVYLLLSAEIEADSRLDPYVAWYFGTKRIGMGRLADGGNQVLWKTPSREGFHTLRVEVYPEPPRDPKAPDLIGASAELTVATSLTAAPPGLPGNPNDYVRLYRFLGELVDSADPLDTGRTFVRTNGAAPAWAPASDSYGLSVSSTEQYRLELPLAPVRSGAVETTLIATRVAVVSSGVIWHAAFADSSGAEGLIVELSSVTGGIQLRLGGGQQEKTSFVLAPAGITADEAMLVKVILSATSQATARLIVNDIEANAISIPLSSALAGTGSVRLGGLQPSAETEVASATLRTAIIDEVAVVVGESLPTASTGLAALED